jgi:hypothetical protein
MSDESNRQDVTDGLRLFHREIHLVGGHFLGY